METQLTSAMVGGGGGGRNPPMDADGAEDRGGLFMLQTRLAQIGKPIISIQVLVSPCSDALIGSRINGGVCLRKRP